MDRRGPDDALEVLAAVDQHALAEEGADVPAAERDDSHEAAVVDVGGHQADLVHVGGQHEPPLALAAHADQAPERVALDPVADDGELGLDHRADALLAAGGPARLGQGGEEVHVHGGGA